VKLNIYIAILRLGLQEKKIKKLASVQLNETQNTIKKIITPENSGLQDTTIRIGFSMQTQDADVIMPLFVALCDYNPATLQADGRHARSIARHL